MITADFHTHTLFSSDSKTPAEQMIEEALRRGLTHYCITDHMDYQYPLPPSGTESEYATTPYCNNFSLNFDLYIKELDRLKQTYAGKIKLLAGIEFGLRNEPLLKEETKKSYSQLLSSYPFDFAIGSSHALEYSDPYYPEYWENKTASEGIASYFQAILDNLLFYDDFSVYGHLDYITRYVPVSEKSSLRLDCLDLTDAILKSLIAKGIGIECNTSGYKYGLPEPHPRKELLSRYQELGGELLTIGSDAHKPEHIAFGFDRASDLLKNLGYRYYTVFEQRKPQFLPL